MATYRITNYTQSDATVVVEGTLVNFTVLHGSSVNQQVPAAQAAAVELQLAALVVSLGANFSWQEVVMPETSPPDTTYYALTREAAVAATSVATQMAAGQTDLVTPAARVAAEALALRDYTVANNFDPTVSGQSSAVGSTMRTLDGTKSWVKTGTGETQWTPLHAISGTFGENVATWDTTALIGDLACDTLGGFRATFDLQFSGEATQVLVVRVNEARLLDNAVGRCYWTQVPGLAAVMAGDRKGRIAEMAAGAWMSLSVTCRQGKSGSIPWVLDCEASYKHGNTYPFIYQKTMLVDLNARPGSAIASIGLAVTDDSYNPQGTMGAASVATIERI